MTRYFHLLLLLFPFLLNGQSAKKLVEFADKEFYTGNFYEASHLYAEAHAKKTFITDISYKLANAYRLAHCYDSSLAVYKSLADQYEQQYPLAVYYTAEMYKMQGSYEKSLQYFRYFQTIYHEEDLFYKKALHEISSGRYALVNIQDSNTVTIQKADSSINRAFFMYGISSVDDNIFITGIPFTNDSVTGTARIYTLRNTTRSLQLIKTFEALNKHISTLCFLTEDTLIFSACTQRAGNFRCELYHTIYSNKSWSTPVRLPDNINCNTCNTTHATILPSESGKYLVFSSDMKDGYGGQDLWIAKIDDINNYSEIKNPGAEINSKGNEITPYFDSVQNKLYYSSDWFNNFGGFDIFFSQKKGETFSAPHNLGVPYNSPKNDYYFTVDHNTNQAYFTSDRESEIVDSLQSYINKIYTFETKNETAKNKDNPIDPAIAAVHKSITLYFAHEAPGINKDFNYETLLKEYKSQKDFYLMQNSSYGFTASNELDILENFFIDEIEHNFSLLQTNAALLNELILNGKKISIKIKAYTSYNGSEAYNEALAERRIKSIEKWLKDNIIRFNDCDFEILAPEVLHEDMFLDKSTDPNELHPYTSRAAFKRKVEVLFEIK